jgi:hypothetical protein
VSEPDLSRAIVLGNEHVERAEKEVASRPRLEHIVDAVGADKVKYSEDGSWTVTVDSLRDKQALVDLTRTSMGHALSNGQALQAARPVARVVNRDGRVCEVDARLEGRLKRFPGVRPVRYWGRACMGSRFPQNEWPVGKVMYRDGSFKRHLGGGEWEEAPDVAGD